MNDKLIVVISPQGDTAQLLINALIPILEREYSNRYAIRSVNSEEQYQDLTNHEGVLIAIIDYYKNTCIDSRFLDKIINLSVSTKILLIDAEEEFSLESLPRKDSIQCYFPGLLKSYKIVQQVRKILNTDINRSLIIVDEEPSDVGDYISSALKGIIGIAPMGSLLAEVVGVVIPNQRMARFERFLQILTTKLVVLEEKQVQDKIKTPEFIDLLEEGSLQAVRAINERRLKYIASLLKNGISEEESNLVGCKTVLAILGQLNDAEILTLNLYGLDMNPGIQERFWDKHQATLSAPPAYLGSPQEEVNKNIVHRTFKATLVRLQLLSLVFDKPKKGELPEFDEDTGMIKSKRYKITPLGRLVLQYIDALGEEI